MKNLPCLLFAFCAFSSLASAQDIHLGMPVWINCDDNPDEFPVVRGVPIPAIPSELKKVQEPAYVEMRLHVSEKGKTGVWDVAKTSPWLPDDFRSASHSFLPAKRKGKAVPCEVALHFIYNPASANPDSADASPRLLEVLPPIYPDQRKSHGENDPVVRVRATVNENGLVIASHAIAGAPHDFANAAAGAVRSWKFAPARQAGAAIAGEVELSVIFQKPLCQKDGLKISMPKPVSYVRPNYPDYLKLSGQQGEVSLRFLVNVEGRVSDVVAIESTHLGFEDEAVASVKRWKFAPGSIDGQPVTVQCLQRIKFALDDKAYMGFRPSVPKSFPKGLPEDLQYDVAPQLEHMALPVYPLEELKARKGGKVTLIYVINPNGVVSQVKVADGAPTPQLAAAAVAALEQFRFTPAGRKGKPCHAMLSTSLEFFPDGDYGHAPVTEETKRILRLLEKSPELLAKADALDRRPVVKISLPPKLSPSNPARGKAVIEFVLDRDGVPRLPRVVSADDPSLGYAACQAVSNWRFERPTSAGKFVDVLVQAPFNFE